MTSLSLPSLNWFILCLSGHSFLSLKSWCSGVSGPCKGRHWTSSEWVKPFVLSTNTITIIFLFLFLFLWLLSSEENCPQDTIQVSLVTFNGWSWEVTGRNWQAGLCRKGAIWFPLPAPLRTSWRGPGEGSPLGSGQTLALEKGTSFFLTE